MVEIEEAYAGKRGIWVDGNEPPASAVLSLTMQPGMDELGISERPRIRCRLNDYKAKLRMNKKELWTRLLSAQLEQEILNTGVYPEQFDGFLLKPQGATGKLGTTFIVDGVDPTHQKKRITYAQTILICPSQYSDNARNALQRAMDKLYFDVSTPSDYYYYKGLERECCKFLRSMMEGCRGNEAYKQVSMRTGIQIYRIIPEVIL